MLTTTPDNKVVFEGIKMTRDQRDAIEALSGIHKGGIGTVTGYRPSTGYDERPVQDIQFISAFSYQRLNERKKKALESLVFDDIVDYVTGDSVKGTKLEGVALDTIKDTFENKRKALIESIDKTASGDRSDAHRQAHDRNYRTFGAVKVNLVSEKNLDGIKVPVVDADGNYEAASILLPIIEIRKTVREPGKRKFVNSGVPKLVENAMTRAIGKRSISYKQISLKDGAFETVSVSNRTIVSEDVSHLPGFDELLLA